MAEIKCPMKLDAHTNARGHWRTRKKQVDREKQTTSWLLRAIDIPSLPVVVTFTRWSSRDLDDDNLPSAFKYVRDTIAAHYGTDDSTRAPITWRYQQRRPEKHEPRHGFTIQIESEHQ
jgi:hypothetical protein